MLAFFHEFRQPVMDCVFEEILNHFLRKGHVMGIFPVLSMEGEDKRQVEFRRSVRGRLSKQDWVMCVDDIQFERGKQLLHKRGDWNGGRNLTGQRQRQAWVAEDEGFRVFVIVTGLSKNENIVPLFHQHFAEGGHGPDNAVHHRMIEIGKKGNVQVFTP